MSSNCRTGLTTLTECQHNNVNDSIQRRLSDWRGWRIPPCRRFFLALLILLSSFFLPSAAQAAIITVNELTDEIEGSCPTMCSIRAALASANPGDEIQFDVNGTIVLTQGELVVDKDLTITGPGAESLALDGNSTSRVLLVNGGVTASIQGLTIQNGSGDGGGIYNNGTLTLTNSTLSGNMAWYENGGGIYNEGTATLTDSTLSDNSVWDGLGGGIFNVGTLALTNSILENNFIETWGLGGGIYNGGGGRVTLTNSTLSSNSGGNSGGGIYNDDWGNDGGATVTLINSTLSGNSATDGGGIFNQGAGAVTLTSSTLSGNWADGNGGGTYNTGRLTLTNSSLSGNSALGDAYGGRGGGIFNAAVYNSWDNILSEGAVTLMNSTLSGNSAVFGGNIYNHEGDEYSEEGTVTLARSIIAHSPSGGNCFGKITSQGDNLSSDSTCVTNNRTLNDRNNTDPLLDPAGLQDNGGPTPTIALQPDSPALDGVRHGTCPPPDTDQRGVPRPSGARCDIGAVEMSADSAPLTVALDIKPGSVKNHINLRSNENIAVAILSTGPDSNAEPFDATRVDPRSVRFGPKGAKATHRKVKDVNHDGEADLILYFKNRATGIQCDDTSASLTGETIDGQAIQGSDTIKTVGLRCIDPEALAKLRRLLRYLVSIHGDHAHGHDQGGATH
jgi:hypothetical protein